MRIPHITRVTTRIESWDEARTRDADPALVGVYETTRADFEALASYLPDPTMQLCRVDVLLCWCVDTGGRSHS